MKSANSTSEILAPKKKCHRNENLQIRIGQQIGYVSILNMISVSTNSDRVVKVWLKMTLNKRLG